MDRPISRRKLLTRAIQVSVGGALALTAGQAALAAEGTCVDMSKLTAGEKSTRESLHWTAKSPHPNKHCSLCAFFQPTSGPCGHCEVLMGPTYVSGYCDSFSPK